MIAAPPCPSESGQPKALARALAYALRREAEDIAPAAGDGGLTEEVVLHLSESFSAAPASQSGAAAADGRGEPGYWRDHGRLTGELMVLIASKWGGCVDLYRRVGRIHDVDYLAYPHDCPAEGERHPVPLVRAMHSAGVHPAVCLAVLEHAPYAEFDKEPSSRLSAALSTAEDLATIAALRPEFSKTDRLSELAKELLAQAVPIEPIPRTARVRVESNVDRFVNEPLRRISRGGPFLFKV